MKICATCGLPNSVVTNHITPIANSKKVHKIVIIRTLLGDPIKKVCFRTVPNLLKKNLYLSILTKLVLMFFENLRNHYDLIFAIYIVPHGLIAYITAKLFRKPLIISLIGTDLNVRLKSKYRQLLFPLLKGSDAVNVTGTRSKEYLVANGVVARKVNVMPNPVDIERFKPQAKEKIYDAIFVGRLAAEKAVHRILQIVAHVNSNYRKMNLVIVGDGPLRKELESQTTSMQLKDVVDFVGFRRNVEDYLNSSKFLLMTSITEGLPLVLIEAMACGLPCVVPNVGDIRDVAIHNYNAKVIDKNDEIEGFAQAIVELLENSKLYARLSRNALKVRETYSFENATQVWEKIFSYLGL